MCIQWFSFLLDAVTQVEKQINPWNLKRDALFQVVDMVCAQWISCLPCVLIPPPFCLFFFFYQTERRRVADVRGSFANSAISPVRQYPPLPTPPTLPPPLVLHYPHRTLQMHSVPSGKKNPWLSLFPLFMSSVLPSLVIIRCDDGGNRLESSL